MRVNMVLLAVTALARCASADSTSIDVRSVVYPGPNCEPPVLRSMPMSPHFLDGSISMEFRVVIYHGLKGAGTRIVERLSGGRTPTHEGTAYAAAEPAYQAAYLAIAQAVVGGSIFEPARCNGADTDVTAVVHYQFQIGAQQGAAPPPGCYFPAVVYKPPAPDDRRGPPARMAVDVEVDEVGSVTPVTFLEPVVEAGATSPGFDWRTEYRRMITDNLRQWRMRPGACNGQPSPMRMQVTFQIHSHD